MPANPSLDQKTQAVKTQVRKFILEQKNHPAEQT